MKLLIRLVFATALLGASLATPASAQYMFLDTNGDGIHTDADDLNANGTPTVATLYVITNQNRDGSPATCDQEPETQLTINSYVVNLQAVGGQVEYSDFTNIQAGMVTNFGEVDADSVHYKNGYGGQQALDPGKYALATITITGLSGSPSIEIIDIAPGSPDFTSFGSQCPGNDFDNTYKLAGPGGGVDWTDADGLGPGPGGNAFPTLDIPAEVVASVGTPITITATATDINPADVLTITYTSTATWLNDFSHTPSVSPATATLSGTPPELSQGNYTVTWTVSDGQNLPVNGETIVIVTEGGGENDCPVLAAIGNQTGNELELLAFTATATDSDPGQSLTFSLSEDAPPGATINSATGLFQWTPTEEQGPGTYTFTVRVADNGSPACVDSETIVVTVNEVDGTNQCPVLTPIGDRTVNEGVLLTFTATATDADPLQTLTFSLGTGAPEGATLDPATGLFNWTPTEAQSPGVYPITIRVFDTGEPACADSETINVTVNEVGDNVCPELAAIGNKTVDELSTLTFTATATDPDAGQTLTFTLDPGFPAGASIDPNTGVFTFTPTEDQGPGFFSVTVRVTDSADPACSDFEIISITVNEVGEQNQCPVLDPIADQTVNEGTLLTFDANATDPDAGQTLRYYLNPGFPAGASIDSLTGVFTFTPTEDQGPGEYIVTIRVTDSGDPPCSDTETVTITVNEVDGENQCPVLTFIGNRTVDELSLLTFTATATDPDAGQTLTFSLDPGFPVGASIDPSTGVFTFTPTEDQGPGTYTVTVRVTDSADPSCSDFETITITVNEVDGENQCPVLAPIGNRTVDELSLLTFTATATDPDAGQTLTFSLDAGFPAGAAIHPTTGVFTFTPTEDQGPGTYTVTVRVTDSADPSCSDFETITITVNEVGGENQCPVLAPIGNRTVNELSLLTFTATATDPDAGQTLTFSLDAGFPAGAAIHPTTGVFTFTPTEDQGPGAYTVTVRVTDSADPSCSDFETITITVNEVDGVSTVTADFLGGNKTTRLWSGKPTTCVQLEVTGDDVIDLSTIQLVYGGQQIAASSAEPSRDRDRDGNREVTACFSKEDLRTLFAGLPSGENMVSIQVVGQFLSGGSFTATATHRVLVRGGNGNAKHDRDGADDGTVAENRREKPRAHPNPINPSTVLTFGTTREGSVKIQVYDLAGRLVRTLYDGSMPAGTNSVAWDGTGNSGGRVASGVYYFRVLSPDGQDVVRVTVLK